jgi:murein DD-endopeptidase MepM/ murein hydrolase activator NlpD
MSTNKRRRTFALLMVSFCAGALTDWWLLNRSGRTAQRPESLSEPARRPDVRPLATSGNPAGPAPASVSAESALDQLRGRRLRMPIDNASVDAMKGGFDENRRGQRHEAVDILAPRNTPVHAIEAGTIAKLFFSKAGGNTIYQFDPSSRICYYYAHLERYADGLREAQQVAQGDVIGYVGTSGNAPPDTPHLHFAVFELGPERHWWQGRAVDPYMVFRR